MSPQTIENVWYLRDIEEELLERLSEVVHHYGYPPGEKIAYAPRINIVSAGAAVRGGKVMTVGERLTPRARPT